MELDFADVALVPAHKRKLLEAVDVLEQARQQLLSAEAEARDSSLALCHQAAQAQLRARHLVADTTRLMASAERLIAEAKAIHGEYRQPHIQPGEA